ncbi:MAG: hypothetical protein CW336_01625 [Bacteroidetes bacterium]|nr:hypothetical protein [Bacteroidota bacterium]
METQKNDEKNIVLEMKRLLGRMMVQVDYMYRNDREMSRLDLDIMMERTREFYELLCDYQSDKVVKEVVEQEPVSTEINEGGELINRDVEFEIETPEEVLDEPEVTEEKADEETEMSFEEENEEVAEPQEEVVENQEETPENIEEEPVENNNEVAAEDEDEEDWEDEDDEVFHVEPTASEPEDNSLAAKLTRAHVDDIRLALGINDKVMIINDLFNGSVERYNKSIDALNDFPTLSGARVYMSELQIELQWDTECQSYKMLNDLVERRFI